MCVSNIQIKNNSIIDKLYNTIKSTDITHNYVSTEPRTVHKTNKYKDNDITLHNLLYNNYFISPDIQMFAKTNDLIFTQYNYNNIKINTYTSTKDKHIQYNINNIIHICNFMRILANKQSEKINVTILFTNIKKKIKETYTKELCLGPENVNSGGTWVAINNKEIRIWRSEEIEKVLIHELIHYLNLDGVYDNKLEKYYRDTFNIKGNINPNESYTETLAIIIYTTYITYIFRKNKKLNGTMIDDYCAVLEYEINFSLFQMAKILHYFKIKSFSLLFAHRSKTLSSQSDIPYGRVAEQSNIHIVQNSSIVSYYLVKIALLFSYNDFINYITDNSIKFHKTDEYTLLVMKTLKSKAFENCVMYYMNKLEDIHIQHNEKNKFIWNTLRMSCIQFNNNINQMI